VWFCCHCDLSARCYVLRHSLNALPPLGHLRDVMLSVGMCRIDFFISVRFQFGFWKKTRIHFGISLVRFGSKNAVRFGYYSYLLMLNFWAVWSFKNRIWTNYRFSAHLWLSGQYCVALELCTMVRAVLTCRSTGSAPILLGLALCLLSTLVSMML